MAIKYKAPKGVHAATIQGHQYEIPKSGIITPAVENHIPDLLRHGFEPHYEEPVDVAQQIEDMDDKDTLVEFIEERGGEAVNTYSIKKLKRLAREAANIED